MDLPIDLSEIVRIEVLEGPAGRIYGTSSLVGAINIVTHPASDTSADFTLEGGSYGYGRISGRGNLKQGRWNNQISAGYSRSDGYSRSESGKLNTDFSGGKAFYQGQYEDESSTNIPPNSSLPFRHKPSMDGCALPPASTGTRTWIAMRGIVDNQTR